MLQTTMPHTAKATINLSAIRHNFAMVKQLAPNSKVMAMMKADAYGHGMIQVAKTLAAADGFAVARLEEALMLRQANIPQQLLWLGGFLDNESLQLCAKHTIDVVVHNVHGANSLVAANLPQPVNVWLKHNSGMYRLGLNSEEFRQADQLLSNSSNVAKKHYMTHFSGADEEAGHNTEQQIEAFQQATADLHAPLSLANSAAIIKYPHTHADWVRPGILLYGVNPLSTEAQKKYPLDLIPAMTLSARIIAIHTINKGDSVGYNSQWQAPGDGRIATLGIGYGDGYPRHAGNSTPILVNGQQAKLVGAVSMDLTSIDITDCNTANIGDEAILWGEQPKVEEIATCADTISYELLTSVSKRVPRFYIN